MLQENRKWAEKIRKKWQPSEKSKHKKIPLIIGKSEIKSRRKQQLYFDPSQPKNPLEPNIPAVYSVALATKTDVNKSVKIAKEDSEQWRETTLLKRHELLSAAARNLRKRRGDLIGIAPQFAEKHFMKAIPKFQKPLILSNIIHIHCACWNSKLRSGNLHWAWFW